MAAKFGSARVDDETKAIIFEGLNMTQLSKLFHLDYGTVTEKIFKSGVKPVGRRMGGDIYNFIDVAPYLIKPIFDVETYIKRMDHRELPKQLTKEFWAGLRSKQDYEEKAGLLWRTETVVERVGELMKLIKMSTLLMLDGVERQTELSDRQRNIIKGLSEGMLTDLMNRIQTTFTVPQDTHEQRQEEDSDEEL